MNHLTGIVTDFHERGRDVDIDVQADDGTSRRLLVESEKTLVLASLKGALAHGDRVRIGFDAAARRAGGAIGRIHQISILDDHAGMMHAA